MEPSINRINAYIDFLEKNPKALINRGNYIETITEAYGERKVKQVLSRYKDIVDLKKNSLKGSKIRKIQVGLSDVNNDDLKHFINEMKKDNPKFESEREKIAFKVIEPKILQKIRILNDPINISHLSADILNAIIMALRSPNLEYEKARLTRSLELERITGLPGKYLKHGWLSHTKGRGREDEERLRLYEELEKLEDTDTDWQHYNEVLAKILVKKHLYHEESEMGELAPGMLIPAPKGKDGSSRWYRVDDLIDSGLGKFAYRLVPATEDYKDLPEVILYRSSATLPTARDAFTSYINDISILPPAYLSYKAEKERELNWLLGNSDRPLIIVGHSLGGSHAQMAMINLQKHLQKKNQKIPRKIELSVFDSPAIKASDAKTFADWVKSQPENADQLKINYYVSQGDPVPNGGYLFGSSYLGNNVLSDNKEVAKVHEIALTAKGQKNLPVKGFGPHGRLFFRGKENDDYIIKTLSIKEYDQKKLFPRIFTNIGRAFASVIVWPTIGAFGGLKRVIFGRRHHDGLFDKICHIFQKRVKI